MESMPGIALSTDERASPEVLRAVRDGAADVGILWGASNMGDFEVHPYRCDQLCLAVRSGHPLANRKALRFEEAIDQISIVVAPGGTLDTILRREAARLSRTISSRVEVSGLDAAVRFVAAGLGTAVLPREGAMGHRKAHALVFVPLMDDWAIRQYVIIKQRGAEHSIATRQLIEYLRICATNQQ